jgi:hypothetical protein
MLDEEELYLKAMSKKYEQWNEAGDPYEETSLPLSDADTNKLKKQQKNFLIVFSALQIGVILFCFYLFRNQIDTQGFSFLFALVFLLIGIYFYYALSSSIKKGKQLIRGIITKREHFPPSKGTSEKWFFTISDKSEIQATEDDCWTYRLAMQ